MPPSSPAWARKGETELCKKLEPQGRWLRGGHRFLFQLQSLGKSGRCFSSGAGDLGPHCGRWQPSSGFSIQNHVAGFFFLLSMYPARVAHHPHISRSCLGFLIDHSFSRKPCVVSGCLREPWKPPMPGCHHLSRCLAGVGRSRGNLAA